MSSIQSEFPTTTTTTSSPAANQPVRRQPRGSINRRACQKCRHLKIKCDGDAENNVSCSNCDYGTCVYDKSPRKNRQVEKLNTKVENLERSLVETQESIEIIKNDYLKKLEEVEILKLEKQIMNLLFDCNNFFADPIVFNQLRQAISESRCWPILLSVVHALLLRLSENDGNSTNNIIATLKTIAESSINYCNPNDAYNPNATLPQNIIDDINISNNQQQLFNTAVCTTTGNISTSMTAGIANLTLSPGSDATSDMSLNIPDYKIELTSPLLAPVSNIINSPHLTPPLDDTAYFSGSDYGNSPVHTTNDFSYPQTTYLDEYPYLYPSSFGSNSSNSGQ